MPISAEPKTAYAFQRHTAARRACPRKAGPNPAIEAIAAARADLAAYAAALATGDTKAAARVRRYAPSAPCLSYQSESPRGERLAHVDKPEAFGLRLVGRVVPESYGGRDTWDSRESCGWHTDPFGDIFRDGTGLCYGLVYQFPARDGRARFVAGYEFGGCDGGPTLDLGRVYEGERGDNCSYDGAPGNPAARDAARSADSMAQRAAEKEREYETGWQLGRIWEEAREEATAARKGALALLAERRAARRMGDGFPAVCAAIRGQVRLALAAITTARETMRKAIEGDGPHGLCVYMGTDEKAAFCDAPGLATFPDGSAH